jgi:hypothetical protein
MIVFRARTPLQVGAAAVTVPQAVRTSNRLGSKQRLQSSHIHRQDGPGCLEATNIRAVSSFLKASQLVNVTIQE